MESKCLTCFAVASESLIHGNVYNETKTCFCSKQALPTTREVVWAAALLGWELQRRVRYFRQWQGRAAVQLRRWGWKKQKARGTVLQRQKEAGLPLRGTGRQRAAPVRKRPVLTYPELGLVPRCSCQEKQIIVHELMDRWWALGTWWGERREPCLGTVSSPREWGKVCKCAVN